MFWYYTKVSTQIRGGFVRFFTQYVEQLPVPDGKERDEIAAGAGVGGARKAAGEAVAELEAQIDAAAYRLFGLGEREIGRSRITTKQRKQMND